MNAPFNLLADFTTFILISVPFALNDCVNVKEITVGISSDSLTLAEKNYFQRVEFAVNKKSINLQRLDQETFDCINQNDADLVLLSKEGLWGGYELSREGVDLLLTELDILILQNSYGEGTYR